MNYLVEQRLTLATPRFTVRSEAGEEVYAVEGKALRVYEQLWMRDLDGREVAFLKARGMVKREYDVFRDGAVVATLVPKRKMFKLNFLLREAATGAETLALGNFSGYEYEFQKNGATVARVKKTRRWADRYALEVADGEDDVVFIATVLAIDSFQSQLESMRDD